MENDRLIFPLAIFPKAIQDIIHDLDVENGYPIPYTAAAFFHAFACAIGNSCTCRFMENWETAPILYTALVGGPGSIKTHPVSFAMAPLARRDRVSLEEYSQQLEQYRSAQPDSRGPKPKARQRIVRDTTLEALVKVLKSNPVGVCVHVDELKGWLSSFNKYRNGGGDKEAWLSMYSGEPIVVNRKTQDEVDTVPHPFASVIGTIQPGVLPKVFQSDIDNGFFPRLLYVLNPDDGEPVLWKEEEDLPSGTAERWDRVMAPVLSFADAFNMGVEEPVTYTFSTAARQFLVDWQNKNEMACAEDISSHAVEFLRKIETALIRFTLVIQVMRDADGGTFGNNRIIGPESAILATILADYYLATVRETYELVITGGDDVEKKMRFYDALNGTFTTDQALAVADVVGISRRTAFRMLDVGDDDPFLKKLRRGLYEKKI